MATIEKGEYFVVVRGFEHGDFDDFMEHMTGEERTTTTPRHKTYDRSYEGDIFLAEEICGPVIAARRVLKERIGDGLYKRPEMVQINIMENEVWPVTKAYVEKFGVRV